MLSMESWQTRNYIHLNNLKKDSTLIFYGFTKYVEIIGEAVYMLTKDFREVHLDVNWRQIEKMRHVLVHGYICNLNVKEGK